MGVPVRRALPRPFVLTRTELGKAANGMQATKARTGGGAEDARTRFLDAAEQLFAQHGYEGARIRAIAKLSNANLGILSHYWGTKQALFRDVLERRLKPVHDEQLRRLRELKASGGPITARAILTAHVTPMFVLGDADPNEAARLRAVLGRAITDPSQEVLDAMAVIFRDVARLLLPLLREACPQVGHAEFYWRVNSMFGAFSYVEDYSERLTRFTDEELGEIDWGQAAAYVVNFLAAGMDAPATKPSDDL
jgi:AcrR family transcriptional regulator